MEGSIVISLEEYPIATQAHQKRQDAKLLVMQDRQIQVDALPSLLQYLQRGDVLVVNNSATIPASFFGMIVRTGEIIEIRLAAAMKGYWKWKAILFGEGSWRTDTNDRKPVNEIRQGDWIKIGPEFHGFVLSVDYHPHLVEIEFDYPQDEILRNFYQYGSPVQYSYHENRLDLWDHQTLLSGPPLSVEPPSASFQFMWQYLHELQENGIDLIYLTHAAGLSSTGNPDLDNMLPLPERYHIPDRSARELNQAVKEGRRIIALGTTVIRALESNYKEYGEIRSGWHTAALKISAEYKLKVCAGLISGMHVPEESHYGILQAFVSKEVLQKGYRLAVDNEFLWHEYGDLTLVLS